MAFIYENGQENKKTQPFNKRIIRNSSPPFNQRITNSREKARNKEEQRVRDCLIGLSLIKKGVKMVNPDLLRKYYK